MTTETEIRGSLATSPLPHVLDSLEKQRSTGVLALAGGTEIWLAEGSIYLVQSANGPTLSSVLFGADFGALEEIDALMQANAGTSVLDHLCLTHPESEASARRLMHEHNLNGLFEVVVPSDQEFAFRNGEVHPLGARFRETTSELVAKAAGRLDTWRKIAGKIPSTSAVFSLAHSLPGRAEDRLVTADEWRYVSYLDGRTSVAEVITETGESAFRVTSALYRLLLEGLIEEVDHRTTRR